MGFESIIKRLDSIEKKKRPLFEDMTKAQSLFNERKPIYERQAQYVIGGSAQPTEIAKKIVSLMNERVI